MTTKTRFIAALKIWIVIYPSITVFLSLFGEALSIFPLYLRTLFLTITLVPWMMFIGLPTIDFLLRKLN